MSALAVGLSGVGTTARAASSSDPGPPGTVESELFSLLNGARADQGKKALGRVSGVDGVARDWAKVMARDNQLKHRPNLQDSFTGAWTRLGENVGVGWSASSLHQGFMDSPSHRDNILGAYDHVGIGVVVVESRIWVTVNFVAGDPSTGGSAPPPAPKPEPAPSPKPEPAPASPPASKPTQAGEPAPTRDEPTAASDDPTPERPSTRGRWRNRGPFHRYE